MLGVFKMYITMSTIFGFNFIITIIVSLMALIVAYYSYRAHNITREYEFGYFSLAFLSFAAAFAMHAGSMIIWGLNASHILGTLTAHSHAASLLLFNIFILLGIVLLFFATIAGSGLIKKGILPYLFMFIIVLSLFLETLFYITSIFLLLLIALFYFIKVIKRKNHMCLFIFISILLFLLGLVRFLFVHRYFCIIQPILFFFSFLIMHLVVIRAYKS
jgi:hypothetical protein